MVWQWPSSAFGEGQPHQDPDGDGQLTTLNLRFPGQYYDAESGLHYNYFRSYNPSTGRYTQSDPIGLAGGVNTFAYAGNDPLAMIDLFGLCGEDGAKVITKVGDSAFIFEGISEIEICQGITTCLATLRALPQHMGLMKLNATSDYYVSTKTATYAEYESALIAYGAGKVGDTANIITVFCPNCAPVTAPISLAASAIKLYYEPTAENVVVPLAGRLAGKILFKSGKLTPNQASSGGAGIELGAGALNE